MFDSLLADGLGSGLAEKVAGYAIKCLAVAGGFLIGYFLGKAVAWGLDRWVFAQKAPDQLKKAVSFVSGLALAILVAILVFGDGGNGFGLGGGTGDGKGTTPADNGKTPTAPPAEPKVDPQPKPVEPPKTPTPKPMPGDMHVVILAGNEVTIDPETKEGRYYLIEVNPTPKTITELKAAVNARLKTKEPELKQVYYRFKNEMLGVGHEAIKKPYEWLTSLKIGFTPE